ncbi:MAG: acetate kinase [Alistipes sp.]|nr:acetate kinase [Alistipes sp.]MBR6662386.1 acetate kinase [Alistipes sp.]
MIVLVLNCGSSSIKYQVIDIDDKSNALLAKGLVDRIGLSEGSLTHKPSGKDKYEVKMPIPDHTTGISLVLEALTDATHGVIENLKEIKAVGHRVAHGGEFFKSSALIDEQAKENIRSLFEIAPLHNPANLEGVLSIEKVLPGVPQVGVFDTSFHQTIPAINYLYALPYEYYDKYRVRKYGFHGTSHKFVAKIGAEFAGLDINNSKIITCHVGNGGSITAVLNGESFDTSMGFSPLDGLVMGTRCGNVDASAVTYIGEREGMSYAELNSMMNKKSGVYGMTGLSSDMRDIDAAYNAGNEKAIVARDMYYNRVKKFVGEYAAEMGGVDLVIFTGGVGENSADLRRYVCKNMEFMGIKLNDAVNDVTHGDNAIISTDDSKVKVAVIATNEELVIATDTYELTKNL